MSYRDSLLAVVLITTVLAGSVGVGVGFYFGFEQPRDDYEAHLLDRLTVVHNDFTDLERAYKRDVRTLEKQLKSTRETLGDKAEEASELFSELRRVNQVDLRCEDGRHCFIWYNDTNSGRKEFNTADSDFFKTNLLRDLLKDGNAERIVVVK